MAQVMPRPPRQGRAQHRLVGRSVVLEPEERRLRGRVDRWDFKQYILGTLFYRFISENLCSYLAEQESDPGFDYARLPDDQAEYGREEVDIAALNAEIIRIVAREQELRAASNATTCRCSTTTTAR